MPNVFMSFLGTNDYLPCTYEFQSRQIRNIRFVQEATIRFNCENWSKDDRVVIFTTEKAYRNNWKDNGHRDAVSGEALPGSGLETCIQQIGGGFSFYQVDIPDGRNEKEIWDIFLRVFEVIQEEDEVIFDITHAFRSIPMLAIVVLNYARIMKNITLQGIYYGALEVLGSIAEAKKRPPEKRIVPVLDLTSFDHLMEWSVATDRFLGSGDAAQISRIAHSSARLILSETKGRDRPQHAVVRLAKNLERFTRTISTCRGQDISHVVERLKENLEECRQLTLTNPLNVPLKTILEKIHTQLQRFPGHFVKDGIQAARWCLEHNLIQQSYTILQETLITYFIHMIGENPEDFKNKNRAIANQAVIIFLTKKSFENWKREARENKSVVEKFLQFYRTRPELIKTYNDLTGFRNDLNHSGYSESPSNIDKFEKRMDHFLTVVEQNIMEDAFRNRP